MKYMLLIYQDELALTETEREECYIESTQLAHDNGLEFAEHAQIAKGLGADIYFAHPYCSWERGTNENTTGIIFRAARGFARCLTDCTYYLKPRLLNCRFIAYLFDL
jgi:IS30 family transposase